MSVPTAENRESGLRTIRYMRWLVGTESNKVTRAQ